jgi:hypothetical protein
MLSREVGLIDRSRNSEGRKDSKALSFLLVPVSQLVLSVICLPLPMLILVLLVLLLVRVLLDLDIQLVLPFHILLLTPLFPCAWWRVQLRPDGW